MKIRYGIWGSVSEGNAKGRLCVLHNVESRPGYAFFQQIANAVSPGYGESMGSNYDGDWRSAGPDLVYTIDPSDDGSKARAFALVQPKNGLSKITMLMTASVERGHGVGFLLLKNTVFQCLENVEKVLLNNAVKPNAKGKHIYGKKMAPFFQVQEENDWFYYTKH